MLFTSEQGPDGPDMSRPGNGREHILTRETAEVGRSVCIGTASYIYVGIRTLDNTGADPAKRKHLTTVQELGNYQ